MKIACKNYVSPGRIVAIGGAIALLALTKTVVAVAILIFCLLELIVFVRKKAIAIKAQELRKKQKSDVEEACDQLDSNNEKINNSIQENITVPLQKVKELETANKNLIDRHKQLAKKINDNRKTSEEKQPQSNPQTEEEELGTLGKELLDLDQKINTQYQQADELLSQIKDERKVMSSGPAPIFKPANSAEEYKKFKIALDDYSEKKERVRDNLVSGVELAGKTINEYARSLELYNVKLSEYQLKICKVAKIEIETLSTGNEF